jgi:DNA polymerase-3 subunit gamma/tau
MLSQAAFNAFLKTLEEPPKHAIFILATTEKHKIIPTILSRCQIFDFKRIGVIDIKNYLKKIATEEKINAEDDALHIIAQKADGALRDALSIFDRVVSFCGSELTREAVTENLNVLDYDAYFKITDLVLTNDIPNVLIVFNDILAKGFDAHHFIVGLASHFRDLLVAKDKVTAELLEVGDKTKNQYLKQAQKTELRFLIEAIEKSNTCDLSYKLSKNQRLLVELTLMQIASITFQSDSSDQKKKPKNFIIPASYFLSTLVEEKIDAKIKLNPTKAKSIDVATPILETKVSKIEDKIPAILSNQKRDSRQHSALSFKSLHVKKESKKKVEGIVTDSKDLPKIPFSTDQAQDVWKKHIANLNKKGEKLLASLMNSCHPIAKKNNFVITLPNSLMKADLEKAKPKILRFIKPELQNFHINFDIKVNEDIEKKFAYTPEEKYEFLKDKNKLITLLKKTFDLEV